MKYLNVNPDKKKLIKAGYIVIVKTPYHWHVRKTGVRFPINVWPTARKVMKEYGSGAKIYTDVVKGVEAEIKGDGVRIKPTPKEQRAIHKFANFKGKLNEKLTRIIENAYGKSSRQNQTAGAGSA